MEWKDVEGFHDMYQVSTTGLVKSKGNQFKRKEKILKHWLTDGYPVVELRQDKKRVKKLVHRLVAQAFIDNEFDRPMVNHKDEDRSNANVENLEWCGPKYNTSYSVNKNRQLILDFE